MFFSFDVSVGKFENICFHSFLAQEKRRRRRRRRKSEKEKKQENNVERRGEKMSSFSSSSPSSSMFPVAMTPSNANLVQSHISQGEEGEGKIASYKRHKKTEGRKERRIKSRNRHWVPTKKQIILSRSPSRSLSVSFSVLASLA